VSEPEFKFFIGMMQWPWFSPEDRAYFHVFHAKEQGSVSLPVEYITAETFNEARNKIHAYVDQYFKRVEHQKWLEEFSKQRKKEHAQELERLAEVKSLHIGARPGDDKPVKPKPPKNRDLLDLCGDLDGE
jgi:hypothetical protein